MDNARITQLRDQYRARADTAYKNYQDSEQKTESPFDFKSWRDFCKNVLIDHLEYARAELSDARGSDASEVTALGYAIEIIRRIRV